MAMAMLVAITTDLAGNLHAAAGLQALIADGADPPGGSNVATRKIVASRRAVRCPDVYGGGGDDDGLWVRYGRGSCTRRLPPVIPSLRATGSSPWALRRTCSADGRIVVSREPAPPRSHVSAMKANGRLTLKLVEGLAVSPLPQPRRKTGSPRAAAEEEAPRSEQGSATPDDATDVPAAEQARALPTTSSPVGSSSSSPPLLATGCFEDVIRTSTNSLRKMHLTLPRMVH